MSKKFKWIMALALCLMLSLSACSNQWEAPYASLQDDGACVSVRFDVNGGLFAGAKDVAVVDVYDLTQGKSNADGTVSFHLLSPDDEAREQGAFVATKNGCFLAGWYAQRSPRVDENGNPLDEYGALCEVSGRPQGYTYADRWDFDSSTLNLDPSGTYSADKPVLTLYAAWIPYINYAFYSVDPATGAAAHLSTVQSVDLEIPEWNQKNGKLNMKDFPEREGKTFDSAYLDAGMTQPLTETIYGKDHYVDYVTGTLNAETVSIYTTWLEGSWFKIFTADQLSSNARPTGNYILMNDLDFSDAIWPASFVKNEFSGTIQGNGYTITGINAIQADNSKLQGGLFGSIGASAVMTELNIENAVFTMEAGCRMAGSSFGLLAGTIAEGAVFKNVTVSGSLLISEKCYPRDDYTVGLLSGTGVPQGITYSIDCAVAEADSQAITVTVHENDTVTVTFLNP